jgi:anaphase-promoting complex subunit 4
VAFNDGVVRLLVAESGKTVHQIDTGVEGITCLGWTANITSVSSLRATIDRFDEKPSGFDVRSKETPLDLPRDLALIDIESSMPKLSVLPAGSTSSVASQIALAND